MSENPRRLILPRLGGAGGPVRSSSPGRGGSPDLDSTFRLDPGSLGPFLPGLDPYLVPQRLPRLPCDAWRGPGARVQGD